MKDLAVLQRLHLLRSISANLFNACFALLRHLCHVSGILYPSSEKTSTGTVQAEGHSIKVKSQGWMISGAGFAGVKDEGTKGQSERETSLELERRIETLY